MAFEFNPASINYDPVKSFSQGYKAGYMPQQLKDEQQMNALKLGIAQNEAKYAPQMSAADLQGKELQNKYQQLQNQYLPQDKAAKNAPKNPSGEFFGLASYWKSLPPGPEKDMVGDRLKLLTTRPSGTTVFDPSTGNPIVQMGGGGSINQPNKLPMGQNLYYKTDENGNQVKNDEGNPIAEGIAMPLSPEEVTETAGRNMFNELQPIVNSATSTYAGKDSWTNFTSDVNNSSKDPAARERVVNYLAAQKLIPALIVKEQKTLGASNTLGAMRFLQKGVDSSDIPVSLEQYKNFVIPSDIYKEAGERTQNYLNDITTKSRENIPAYNKRPFNPEQKKDIPKPINKENEFHPDERVEVTDNKTGQVMTMTAKEAKEKGYIKG